MLPIGVPPLPWQLRAEGRTAPSLEHLSSVERLDCCSSSSRPSSIFAVRAPWFHRTRDYPPSDRQFEYEWARPDSNWRPSPCQGDVITTRLRARAGGHRRPALISVGRRVSRSRPGTGPHRGGRSNCSTPSTAAATRSTPGATRPGTSRRPRAPAPRSSGPVGGPPGRGSRPGTHSPRPRPGRPRCG